MYIPVVEIVIVGDVARCRCFYDRSMPMLLLLASFDRYSGAPLISKNVRNLSRTYETRDSAVADVVVVAGEHIGHERGPKLPLLTVASWCCIFFARIRAIVRHGVFNSLMIRRTRRDSL